VGGGQYFSEMPFWRGGPRKASPRGKPWTIGYKFGSNAEGQMLNAETTAERPGSIRLREASPGQGDEPSSLCSSLHSVSTWQVDGPVIMGGWAKDFACRKTNQRRLLMKTQEASSYLGR